MISIDRFSIYIVELAAIKIEVFIDIFEILYVMFFKIIFPKEFIKDCVIFDKLYMLKIVQFYALLYIFKGIYENFTKSVKDDVLSMLI